MKGFLIAYDLSDDRLRQRVSRRLEREGTRVQESVFEVFVKTDAAFERLRRDLEKLLGTPIEGQVRWYGLNLDALARAGALGCQPPSMPPAVIVR